MSRSQRGSVLVMAMWALMMLTAFAVSLGFGVRQKAALLNRLTTLDALYPIAYSGVEKAKSLIREDTNTDVDTRTDSWSIPRASAPFSLAGGSFTLGMDVRPGSVDEERKINLNFTKADVLLRLFQIVAGLDQERAQDLVYCALDWMDSDSFFGHPQYGAENGEYEDMKYPYAAKNAPYEVLDELLLVKGMTPQTFERLRPYVTVYGSGQVNINTASREVLSALGFSPKGVDTIAKFRAGSDGIEGNGDDNFFLNVNAVMTDISQRGGEPLDAGEEAVLNSLLTASSLCVKSTAFSVLSHGVYTKTGASMDVEAVLDRKGNSLYCRASEVRS